MTDYVYSPHDFSDEVLVEVTKQWIPLRLHREGPAPGSCVKKNQKPQNNTKSHQTHFSPSSSSKKSISLVLVNPDGDEESLPKDCRAINFNP